MPYKCPECGGAAYVFENPRRMVCGSCGWKRNMSRGRPLGFKDKRKGTGKKKGK